MKRINRFTALLLTIAMMVTLVGPQMLAADSFTLETEGATTMIQGETGDLTLRVTSGGVTLKNATSVTAVSSDETIATTTVTRDGAAADTVYDFTQYAASTVLPKAYQIAEAGWQINATQTTASVYGFAGTIFKWGNFGMTTPLPVSAKLAIDVTVPEDGTYGLGITGAQYSNGGVLDFSVDGTVVGNYDFKNTTTVDNAGQKVVGAVTLTKGVHTILLQNNSGKTAYLYLRELSLVPLGDTATVHVKGVKLGQTSIDVSATIAGETQTIRVPVEIKGIPGLKMMLEDETAFAEVKPGVTNTSNVLVTLDGLPTDVSALDSLTVEMSDNFTAEATIAAGEMGKAVLSIKGGIPGMATATITAKKGTYNKTLAIPVTVKGREYVYSFFKLQWGDLGAAGNNPNSVTDWGMTTMGDPKEMNAARKVYTDPWKWNDISATGYFIWADQNYGLILGKTLGAWAAIDIRVSETGAYNLALSCMEWNRAPITNVYVAPATAINPRAPQYLIGSTDTFHPEASLSYQKVFPVKNVYLEAGDYTVTLENVGKNEESKNEYELGIGKILLNSPTTRELSFGMNERVFRVDSTREEQILTKLNGIVVDASNIEDLTVTVEDPTILEATTRMSEDGKQLTLVGNGKKVGTTNVIVSGKFGDSVAQETLAVSVVPKDQLYSVKFSVPKTELTADESMQIDITGTLADGTPITPATEGITVFYESSNRDVATVSKTGLIEAKGSGDAKIMAYVTKDGVTLVDGINLKVTGNSEMASVTLHALAGVPLSKTSQLSVTGRLQNGMPLPASAVVSYSVVSTDPEGAIKVSSTGLVTGMALGTGVVKATVTLDGKTMDTEAKTITVYQPEEEEQPEVIPGEAADIYIDFKEFAKNFQNSNTMVPRAIKVGTYGWQVNETRTSASLMALPRLDFRWQVYGINTKMADRQNDQLVLDVMVPGNGNYQFEVTGGQYAAGMMAEFFIDGVYMGEYDMYDKGAILSGEPVTMNTIPLKAGIHQVTIRHATNSKYDYLYLGSLMFRLKDTLPTKGEVALGTTHTVMSVGEKAHLLPGTQMSDGTVERVGYLSDGSFAADPDNFITSVTKDDSTAITMGRDYLLTANGPGSASFAMVATIGGVAYTKNVTVTVDAQQIDKVTASLKQPILHAGENTDVTAVVTLPDGRVVSNRDAEITYVSSDARVAEVVNGELKTYKEGSAQITVSAAMAGKIVSTILTVDVLAAAVGGVKIEAPTTALKPNDTTGVQLSIMGISTVGLEMELPSAETTWMSQTPNVVSVSNTGLILPVSLGTGRIQAQVQYQGKEYVATIDILVKEGKTSRTYYTDEKLDAAQENIAQFDWAKSAQTSAVETADAWMNLRGGKMTEFVYDHMATQEIPRSASIGFRLDPEAYYCRYCGCNLQVEYDAYAWILDPVNKPWKVQCPKCRRNFPSNDFSKFYEAGINENGNFSYDLAKERGSQYLTNDLYPEKDTELGVTGWGVDDGRGYRTGKYYDFSLNSYMNTYFGIDVPQMEYTHTYISYYAHWGIWYNMGNMKYGGVAQQYIEKLTNAYIYTKDAKYGRALAILIDRVADVYPEMEIKPNFPWFFNSDSTTPLGKMVGTIWQHGMSRSFVLGYDAAYDMYDDPSVIDFLSKKAKQFNMDKDWQVPDYKSDAYKIPEKRAEGYEEPMITKPANPKTSGALIRQNVEENLLKETWHAMERGDIHGNFGMHQSLAAYTAVVYDTMPYTKDMIDWMNRSSADSFIQAAQKGKVDGANVTQTLIENVSRDGTGQEAAPNYNILWVNGVDNIVKVLGGYEGYKGANLYENPKVIKMYKQCFPLTLVRRETAAIGDSGSTANKGIMAPGLTRPFLVTGDPEMGQMLYMKNGNTTKGLHGDIFESTSQLQKMVQDVIDKYGEYNMDKSEQMTGFGFAITRGGSYYKDITGVVDNQRDVWIYYGKNSGHGHPSAMNLGMEAYGLNFAPDLGYPEAADGGYKNVYWGKATINHNTVMVNTSLQSSIAVGYPKHFDDSGRVKLIDVSAPKTYAGVTSEYRRTAVSVEANDDIAYTIDFFRVRGGNDHIYSFHAASNNITEMENLDLVTQPTGTYAGASTGVGENSKLTNGFNFLYNVRHAYYPGNEFMVDFKVDDFRKFVGKDNLHLRMTMLNDFDLNEVALTKGQPPQRDDNPKELEFVLARRTGTNLDSLFTTVFEPYDGERYIEKQEQVPVVRTGGGWETAADAVKAVKVTLKNGRVDYIVYATNNKITYRVDDKFDFQGFVGVYTMEGETPTYSYVNDGTKIGEKTGTAAYTGVVRDFTKGMAMNNSITVKFKSDVDLYRLQGQWIYIANDEVDNAVYQIKGVEAQSDGTVKLDLGDITLIRGMVDTSDQSKGYTYNIKEGQTFSIPLSTIQDDSPVFTPIKDQITNAGSTLEFTAVATSPAEKALTYRAGDMPRGAQVDAQGKFTWSPDGSQIGDHHASIVASDGTLETTIHFAIKVYPQTNGGGGSSGGPSGEDEPKNLGGNVYQDVKTGKIFSAGPDQKPDTVDDLADVVQGADGKYYIKNADGTYRAAGPDGLLGTEDDLVYKPGADNKIGTKDDTLVDDGEVSGDKFVDLDGYDWAKDAIKRLTERKIIKGTSETTFAPGRDISRADFATLVVRALELTAEAKGEFTDVNSSDYFYNEVQIAQALGIVQGSDGKFRPGDSITREDMMVMLARALDLAKGTATDLETFLDTGEISDYALDAVATLVKSGLITGSNGKINPKGNATRAEVAVLLDRLLGKLNTLTAK